jgi:hypothetical protein
MWTGWVEEKANKHMDEDLQENTSRYLSCKMASKIGKKKSS